MFLLVVGVLCGCNTVTGENEENNTATYHKLTVQDPNGYIIEELQGLEII